LSPPASEIRRSSTGLLIDHGGFIAIGFVALLLLHGQLTWRDRVRHGLLYAALVLALR
jgi:hypothetical protein